jgi:hypothetical protein
MTKFKHGNPDDMTDDELSQALLGIPDPQTNEPAAMTEATAPFPADCKRASNEAHAMEMAAQIADKNPDWKALPHWSTEHGWMVKITK